MPAKRLRFQCDMQWDQMIFTDRLDVRHCDRCSRDVHLVRSDAEFWRCAKAGECVAIEGKLPTHAVGMPEVLIYRAGEEPPTD